MANSLLDYYKIILQKVSFDQALLVKELNKALNALDPSDASQLKNWLASSGLSISKSTEPRLVRINATDSQATGH
jgi:hypothetical protein